MVLEVTEPRAYLTELTYFLSIEDNYVNYRKFVTDDFLKSCPKLVDFIDFFPVYFKFRGQDEISDWNDFLDVLEMKTSPTERELEQFNILASAVSTYLGRPTLPIKPILQEAIDMQTAEKIAQLAIEISAGSDKKTMEQIQKELDTHLEVSVLSRAKRKDTESTDMEEAVAVPKGAGLTWPLQSLNSIIGPFHDEFFIVASRPDGGKTTLLSNIAVHVAQELPDDKKVFWFCNEESIRKIKRRAMTAALQIKDEDIDKDPISCVAKYKSLMGDRLVFVDNANSVARVQKVLDRNEGQVGLVFIDQLYKVRGNFGKTEVEAERFRQLCEWARDIGKYTAPCIVTNQLDGSAENEKFPTMEKLYGSKTGAQGEADCIMILGKDVSTPDKRYFYTPKNKLTGRVMSAEWDLDKERGIFSDR